MKQIIHRVPDGSSTVTANCGQALGEGDGHTGWYGADPLLASFQQKCARGCYPKHARDLGLGANGDAIADLRAKLTGIPGGKHRAEVAA